MGQDNIVPRRIDGVEGVAGQVMVSGGPGVVESWGAMPAAVWTLHSTLSPAGVATISSAALAAHDLWMVILDITFDVGAITECILSLRLNADAGNNYGSMYADAVVIINAVGQNHIMIGSTSRGATVNDAIIAQLLIRGKTPSANAGSRVTVAVVSGSSHYDIITNLNITS
ncbi:unnamed protein product [marine sediment metagenome]|uniref:Uncharacterized protein n=1 Tax=marine sediment metagenome TaxID=412755 RepID=X1FW02_9ZZZZ